MRILFLNQYFPPDPAPTGVLLQELADELAKAGHCVEFLSASQVYRDGQPQRGRLRREAGALARILWRGLFRPRPDLIISATSPPGLILVATFLAFYHGARSIHWIMDLYPELALALEEIRPGPAMRGLGAAFGWCYRRSARVVVLDGDMAAKLECYGVAPAIIRPWVLSPLLAALPASFPEPEPPWTWIYSGNLGRAHEWATLLEAQALLEQRGSKIHLRFQGGGPSRPAAEARARELGLRQVEWLGYVPEGELPAALLRCEVNIVTQRAAAHSLLWPSKLGLVLSLPRPIVWVGPLCSDIAQMLEKLPQTGLFAPGQSAELADWLLALWARSERAAPPVACDPVIQRKEALSTWIELIEEPPA